VRQGGSGLVVLRVGEHVVEAGVVAGDVVSPAATYPRTPPDQRVVLFAIPWDLEDGSAIRAFVVDDAGNRVEQPFVDGYRTRQLRSDTVRVTDDFLQRVVPAIASRTPGFSTEGSLLEQYLRINGEYRRQNLLVIRDLAAATADTSLWSGAFEQLPRGAVQAGFADRRVYSYDDREVDRQTHLGLDLASTARAPVPAANTGRVVWADWLAIYGNVVLIDHGLGLMTGYGHLSQIDVTSGDVVAKGQVVGRTGTTGLAGGDHLHFEVFVHGQSVDPLEWLDPEWVRTTVLDRLPGS
jgi:murein DD-endopeptidase MepM/ murein hydrolase activator NlpD